MRDPYPSRSALSSGRGFFAVTPSDDNNLPAYPKGIWVGTGGDLAIIGDPGSDPVTLTNVPDGVLLPISPSRILASGTTASDIVGIV